jgi:hypothetical protein
MIRPLTITIPITMLRITGIHIATLDIRRVIWAPTRGVDAAVVSASLGVNADAVCGPGASS